jgi:SulP family sulfate permease
MDRSFSKSALFADLMAGFTTGIISVPQGMAFAIIANVPLEHGLYAMIIPTIAAALIRSSPFLITGATNTSALVIGALVGVLPAAQSPDRVVPVMLLITLMMGLIQVAAGALRLGSIGRYVSLAVLLGFTFGAGVLIIVGQLKNVLGIHASSKSPLLLEEVALLFSNIGATTWQAVVISMISLMVVFICARISKLIPGAFLAIAVSGAVVWFMNWQSAIPMLGEVPRALPKWTLPPLTDRQLIQDVSGPSLAVAILGMVEAISIGKALSAKARIKFYANQELVAKGAGNVLGAFFGCMPTSASWTRSVINMQMGAKTRWVGVIAGVTVLIVMLALAPFAHFVPKASLGAIVVWIALHMFDVQTARQVWSWSRRDAAVMVITFAAILVLEIQYAIYLGVIASLLLLIHKTSQLHMIELAESSPNQYREMEIDGEAGRSPLILLQLEGDLFFGVAEELEEKLEAIAQRGAKIIIIRMKRTHGLDATAQETLSEFARAFRESGGRLMLCGLRSDMLRRIENSQMEEAVGKENLFPMGETNFGSVQKAVEHARALLKEKGMAEPLMRQAAGDVGGALSYSI